MGPLMLVVFLVIVLVLFGLIGWYAPARLARLLGRKRRWPYVLGGFGLIAIYIAAYGVVPRTAGAFVGIVSIVAGVLLVLLFYAGLTLLVLGLVRRVVPMSDRLVAGLSLGAAVLVTAFGVWSAYRIDVAEVEIPMPGLAQDVTVVHVADVHLGPHRGSAWLARLVAEINAAKPDFVLLNGDIVEGGVALENGAFDPLSDLEAPAYYTTGNHEAHLDTERAFDAFRKHGVKVLRNQKVDVHGLQLVGLDYMRADDEVYDMHVVNPMTMEDTLPTIPLARDRPILLMHHSPVGIEYAAKHGASLMVAGHTHAGQVWPATWIGPLAFPFFDGLYEVDGTRVWVSQGAGTFGVPMRIGTSNRIDVLRLRAAQSAP